MLYFQQGNQSATNHAIQNLVQRYLTSTCGGDEHILGAKALKTLRLSREARQNLLVQFRQLSSPASQMTRDWEKWLKGDEQHLFVTFAAESANENSNCQLISPVHPLALQAAQGKSTALPVATVCRARSDVVPAGNYPFIVYQWQMRGVRNDVELRAVCANTQLQARLLDLLEAAEGTGTTNVDLSVPFDELETAHHALWSEACNTHKQKVTKTSERRIESLRASHRARINILRDQRQANSNARIQRMRDQEIANAQDEYARRTRELEQSIRQADILHYKVAHGILVIESGGPERDTMV